MPLGHPILQFGTSRFLQAHVDLFVSQALDEGRAIGGVTVVHTSGDPQGAARVAALSAGRGYRVRLQGLRHGHPVDELCESHSVRAALTTRTHWNDVRHEMTDGDVRVIVSNTGDAGWLLADADGALLVAAGAAAPQAFPAKLLVLLHDRWRAQPELALTLLPCELVSRNGDRLRDLVAGLARAWRLPSAFEQWLREHLVWGNSLVDRIVSAPLQPVGAIAEPYALWAIARTAGLLAPCTHPAIVMTDGLERFERLKLWLLNLAHTLLAELWLRDGRPAGRTVLEAMQAPASRSTLEGVWTDEVLPVFDALGEGDAAGAYRDDVRERLLNPFLAHRLSDIAANHDEKKARRFAPVVAAAREHAASLAQPWLRGALASSGRIHGEAS
jgi:tagaturonate reductase